ncbi:eukaryotic cytochrome b561-domain-containing protein [Blyttiomyces helicus]|uniref:Eukaryotic cytochrome b561-domain-containing protein n=1 Tax=Blyttiomyces helicus TaxID=388810 RepID=A0A4P9W920_9FUNG|nr:eukaryotic cytochrome b561-domain-containing protein [Blyttiomyces helicus]|eukprot:RKO86686.1 eukaryotic cytochrome b561-domain-containing protein [Blyttiomyces helicus]
MSGLPTRASTSLNLENFLDDAAGAGFDSYPDPYAGLDAEARPHEETPPRFYPPKRSPPLSFRGLVPSSESFVSMTPCRRQPPLWATLAPRAIALAYASIHVLWLDQAEGGVGLSASNLFGYHGLLMSLFVVLFTQEAVLAYSAPLWGVEWGWRHRAAVKAIHATLHILGLTSAILGLIAISHYKTLSTPPSTTPVYPNYKLYSPHSWLGVTMLALWATQFPLGFILYVLNADADAETKRDFGRYHRYLGACVYALGLATVATGLQDMQGSDLAASTPPGLVGTVGADNMTGYLPDSQLAEFAAAQGVLVAAMGIATFFTWV